MKISFNKKIIIGFVILFILFGVGIAKYSHFNSSYITFSGNNISFSYSKEVNFEDLAITSNRLYKQYRIRRAQITGPDGSYISIYEPIQNSDKKSNLADNVRPEFISLIQPVVINGLKGEFVTYRLDEQLPGDQPVHADITKIYLSSQYTNTPISLFYSRSDTDSSLDETWNLILKTIRY